MLDALVDAKFLSVAATGAYARATDDVVHSAPMASQRRLRLMKRPAPSLSRETSVRKLRKP
jgi:hypothetical protein